MEPTQGLFQPEKVGAGLLLCCKDQVLLLLRNSQHNNNTWGLPGGNVDDTDTDLLAAAVREAKEELGHVPHFSQAGSILVKRGKRMQKHYTVFVVHVDQPQRTLYTPVLNEEHREWRWFPASTMFTMTNLHPVVEKLVSEHADTLQQLLPCT